MKQRRAKKCYFCNLACKIVRRVGGQNCCQSCSNQIDQYVMKKNPQLQILENPAGYEPTLGGAGDVEVTDADINFEDRKSLQHLDCLHDHMDDLSKSFKTFCEFHDVNKYGKETEMMIDNGDDAVTHISFAALGKVPAISWIDKENGKQIKIQVEDETIDFVGFRLSASPKPFLVSDPDNKEALIIGKSIQRFKEFIVDDSGFIGVAPMVEYMVPWKSNKRESTFIHAFYPADSAKPKLVWDYRYNGLRYSGGTYKISKWFFD